MQFRSTYLKIIAGMAFCMLITACFKKYEEVDQLNTNMFDRNYEGGAWFDVDSVYYYVTPLGTGKARFEVSINDLYLPKLKPSNIEIELSTEAGSSIIDFPLVGGGRFEKIIDLPYTGSGTYCLFLGVFVPSDSTVINKFEGCGTL